MYDLPPDQWKEISLGRRFTARVSQAIPARPRLRFFGLPSGVVSVAEAGDAVEAVQANDSEGLYRIPRGWVWTGGAHLDAKNRLVDDLSPGVNRPAAWWFVRRQRFFPPVIESRGPLFSLIGDGAMNLYHWTFDILPRLRWLDPARRSQVCVLARAEQPFHKVCLEAAGFSASSIVVAQPMTLYRPQELLVSKIEKGRTPANFALAREVYLKASESVPKSAAPLRLYISRNRATSRRIVNEEELLRILEPRGFRTVHMETLPLPEQLALFRDAEAILAPTGAALTQIHLCPPDAKLLVIMPERCDDFVYRDMAKVLGLSAEMLIAPPEPRDSPDPVKADLFLDPACLAAIEKFVRGLA